MKVYKCSQWMGIADMEKRFQGKLQMSEFSVWMMFRFLKCFRKIVLFTEFSFIC